MNQHNNPKFGIHLDWFWEVHDAINCLHQIANGMDWRMWQQHEADTRGIVTDRAAIAIRKAIGLNDKQPK